MVSEVMHKASVGFRPVDSNDDGFLFALYASTREDELAGLPFDESQRETFLKMQFAAQKQDYQKRFPDGEQLAIMLEDTAIGRLYVARNEGEIRILDIALVPALRNKGIGTSIITRLLGEAARARKPIRIYVERFNPSIRLFERLGFCVADDIGTHFLMEAPAGSP